MTDPMSTRAEALQARQLLREELGDRLIAMRVVYLGVNRGFGLHARVRPGPGPAPVSLQGVPISYEMESS
jgi:hypothetical protein